MGRGGWGVPGVVDRALESTGGYLLETLRTSRPVMRLPGCPNSIDIHQSVLGCVLSPRTAVKYDFPEDFLKFPNSSKMRTAAKACLTSVMRNVDIKVS